MIVTTIIGTTAVATTVGFVYVSRKAWRSFHRAVGIEPGKMEYVPYQAEQERFKPQLIQVNLTNSQLVHVPKSVQIQLQRIDDKADSYQNWRAELEQRHNQHAQSGQSVLHTTENQFVLSKLMSEHLPEIVNTYHNIHERKLKFTNQGLANQSQVNQSRASHSAKSLTTGIDFDASDNQALSMLIDLLNDIENRLDTLLHECEQIQLQDLKIMKRYLQARD